MSYKDKDKENNHRWWFDISIGFIFFGIPALLIVKEVVT